LGEKKFRITDEEIQLRIFVKPSIPAGVPQIASKAATLQHGTPESRRNNELLLVFPPIHGWSSFFGLLKRCRQRSAMLYMARGYPREADAIRAAWRMEI